ncbi:hypothetical protein [Paenibacillus sp. UMB4589-SE434]|uniref:hypothetical protein n=1 Tax=Paenibacillus sp. UMB4589-SE434 TaxID=3046314 RepID=UPI00254CC781|nr:hypothetical protein [Paenibacillus sp. UMB4589-SE434]MDK8182136.1 hypothetical protein [Paenibacillus sp. UMB4589-SE434]
MEIIVQHALCSCCGNGFYLVPWVDADCPKCKADPRHVKGDAVAAVYTFLFNKTSGKLELMSV